MITGIGITGVTVITVGNMDITMIGTGTLGTGAAMMVTTAEITNVVATAVTAVIRVTNL